MKGVIREVLKYNRIHAAVYAVQQKRPLVNAVRKVLTWWSTALSHFAHLREQYYFSVLCMEEYPDR